MSDTPLRAREVLSSAIQRDGYFQFGLRRVFDENWIAERKWRQRRAEETMLQARFFVPALPESWVEVEKATFVRDPVFQQENCNRTYHR
jgi:hypothetical protein